jgi:hypothetical protein
MKHRSVIFLALILLVLSLRMAFADPGFDDKGQINDPTTNDRANACFEGGEMEGKCDTDWTWSCGWYLIRFQTGMIPRNLFPATCASLLPPEPPAPAAGSKGFPTAGCVFIAIDVATPVYLNFNGGNFVGPSITLYDDPGCSIVHSSHGLSIAYAPNGAADALAICTSHGYTTIDTNIGVPLEPGIYRCIS